MNIHKINIIKSQNIWFADYSSTKLTPIINGVNQIHLKKINIGDSWIDLISEGSDNFWITLSDFPIENGYQIKILNKKSTTGKELYCVLNDYKGKKYNSEFTWCFESLLFTFGRIPSPNEVIYFLKHD